MQVLVKTTIVEFEDDLPITPDTQAWVSARTRTHTIPQRATLVTTSALFYHWHVLDFSIQWFIIGHCKFSLDALGMILEEVGEI